MNAESENAPDLIYGLEDRPAPIAAVFAALQHVLASFVGLSLIHI